jgi:MoxR-like ATPase
VEDRVTELRGRWQALRAALETRFVERDELVGAALAALVAGQHVLLVGPPGTAKSQLAEGLVGAIEEAVGFRWLLTRFTTPEELFGPVSLSGLEHDRYERVTAGKLPRAHVVFLDEVFKASSAILNALLTVLAERKFHNGDRVESVPLLSLIGATNELPDEDELQALYDRFLVRVVVDYVQEDFRFLKLLTLPDDPPPLPSLTLGDLQAAQVAARAVPIDEQLLRDLPALRRRLKEEGVVCSDRRWKQSLGYLQAVAWLKGHERVTEAEVPALTAVLWGALDEREVVRLALEEVLAGELTQARRLLFQVRELALHPERFREPEIRAKAALEAYTKANRVRQEAQSLVLQARRRGRAEAPFDELMAEIGRLCDGLKRHLQRPLQ